MLDGYTLPDPVGRYEQRIRSQPIHGFIQDQDTHGKEVFPALSVPRNECENLLGRHREQSMPPRPHVFSCQVAAMGHIPH